MYTHFLYYTATVNVTSPAETSSTPFKIPSTTTQLLVSSVQTSLVQIFMPTPSAFSDMPPPLTVTTTVTVTNTCEDQSNIQTREMIAWLLTVLLTMLLTVLFTVVIFLAKIRNVHNQKRKLLKRKGNEAQEDELEENPGYEASNAQTSLCEVMKNPCYIASEARRISETQLGIYESIK